MSGISPQDVLARIPGWQGARIDELSGGLSNRTWRVESTSRRGVLKIDEEPRGEPFNTRIDEQRIQTSAAELGIANKVFFADECAFLTEFVDGNTWSTADLEDESKLTRLAALLRQVHSLPLTGRIIDAVDAAGKYVNRIDASHAVTAARCKRIVQQLHAPQNICCCHNDLVAENIIETPALRLLDWEYACDNDPFFDLATIIAHHKLSDEHADVLLNAYFDGDGARWKTKLEQQMRLYNALLWLWSASRPDADDERLLAIVERLA